MNDPHARADQDDKLSLDDATPVFEKFKPRIRELLNSIPDETITNAKDLGSDIAVEILSRGSRHMFRMVADKIQDRING